MSTEHFTVQFVAMGQGDCTIIECPDGELIVVDCGRSKGNQVEGSELDGMEWFYDALINLRAKLAGGSGQIAALVLSHPDRDHYNLVYDLLDAWPKERISELDGVLYCPWTWDQGRWQYTYKRPKEDEEATDHLALLARKVRVKEIYFSMGCANAGDLSHLYLEQDGPMANYGVLGAGTFLQGTGAALIEPFIRQEGQSSVTCETRSWTRPKRKGGQWEVQKAKRHSGGAVTIHSGQTTKGARWSVKIIAANVRPQGWTEKSTVTQLSNDASLIVLCEIDGRGVLLCTDGGLATEEYLKRHAPKSVRDALSGVDLAQMAHHGSHVAMYRWISSATKPSHAVASMQFRERTFLHPRYEAVMAWAQHVGEETQEPAHHLELWRVLQEPYQRGEIWRGLWRMWYPDMLEPEKVFRGRNPSLTDPQGDLPVYIRVLRKELLPDVKTGTPCTTSYLGRYRTQKNLWLTSLSSYVFEVSSGAVKVLSYGELQQRALDLFLPDEDEKMSLFADASLDLDALLRDALQGQRFTLSARDLPESPARRALLAYLPEGKLQLGDVSPPELRGDAVTLSGAGLVPPLLDQPVTLTLTRVGGLTLRVERAAARALGEDFAALKVSWLGALPLAQLTWILEADGPPPCVRVEAAEIGLDVLAEGLGALLGVERVRVSGSLRLAKGRLRRLHLSTRVCDTLPLGPLQLRDVTLHLGAHAAPDVMGGRMLTLPTLGLSTRLRLTAGGAPVDVPMRLQLDPTRATVAGAINLDGPLSLGLNELASLLGVPTLSEMLPESLPSPVSLGLEDLTFELDSSPTPRLRRLSAGVSSAGSWALFRLPGGERTLALTQLSLSVEVLDPFTTDADVSLHVGGALDLGGHALRASCASSPWRARLWLDAEAPTQLGELADALLTELGVALPPMLRSLSVEDLDATIRLDTGALDLSLGVIASSGLPVAGALVYLSATLDLRYDPAEAPALVGAMEGEITWRSLRFHLSAELGEDLRITAKLLGEARLSALVRELLGAELPPGVPDLASRDLTFSIGSDGGLSLSGAFEVAARSFTLGDQPLALATLAFAFAQDNTQTTASITISGSTSDKLIPGVRCEGYALTFTYDARRDDDTVWSLGGDVTLVFFDTLKLALGASYTASKTQSTLTLKLGADQEGGGLLEVAPGGRRVASLDAASVTLKIIQPTEGKTSWEFVAGSSLRLFAPGAANPTFALTGGVARFERDADAGELSLSFSAEAVQLFAMDYVETIEEPGPGDEPARRQVPRCFKARLGVDEITLKKAEGWSFDAAMTLSFEDLPVLLRGALTDRVGLRSRIDAEGLRFETEGGLEPLIIPDLLKAVADEVEGLDLPALGDSAVQLTAARLLVGKELDIELEMGAALPQHLNRFLGLNPDKKLLRTWDPDDGDCFTTASLRVGTAGLSCQLERSPFLDLPGVKKVGEVVTIDFQEMFADSREAEDRRFDLGAIHVTLPKVRIDVKKGALDISGGYRVDKERGVCMPLVPLRRLLALMQLGALAEALPAGLPIKTRALTPEGLRGLMGDLNIPVSPPIAEALGAIGAAQDKLPGELVKYLSINVPDTVDFALKVTPRGSFTISVSTEGDPLQVLIPSPAGLLGLRLSHLAGGNFIGNVLKFEISADIDFFDWPLLLGAATLLHVDELKPWLTPRERLRRGVELRALTVLIFFVQVAAVPVPVPVPVFYDRIEWWLAGVEGLEARGRLEFPEPEVDLVAIVKLLAALKESFAKNIDLPDVEVPVLLTGDNTRDEPAARKPNAFVFNAGPLYLSLPLWMGSPDGAPGQPITFGTRKRWEILDSLRLSQIVFNGGRHILMDGSTTYAVTALDISHRIGSARLGLFNTLRFEVDWAFATPKEFAAGLRAGTWAELGGAAAKDILALLPGKTRDSDEGLVTFLRGRFAIARVLSFEVCGGAVLAGATAGTGLRFLGRIEPDLLRVDLRGLARIDVEEKTVLLHGSGELAILNQPIVSGAFTLHERGLIMRSALDLDAIGLPIALKGSLEGRFSDTELFLEGELGAKIGFLTAKGKDEGGAGAHALVHFSPTVRQLRVAAHLRLGEAGAVEFMAGIREDGADLKAVARFSGHVLGLIAVELGGALELGGAALTARGDGHLDLLGQRILEASFSLTEEELRFSGALDLFKGLNTGPMPLAVTGTLEGHIRHDQVDFHAGGEIVLGSLRCGASVELQATQKVGWLRITADELFGAKIVLELKAGQGTPDELVFHSHSSQALRLMHGALRVSAASDPSAGPEASMRVSKAGLQALRFDGAATLLGMRSAAVVRYEAPRLCFAITQRVQWRPEPAGLLAFDAGFTLTGDFNEDHIFVKSSFGAMFDLGPVLSAILRALTGLSLPPPRLALGFEVETLELRVDTSPATRKQDAEARARRQALQAQLRELARGIREARARAARGQEALEAGLKRLAAAPNVVNSPERRARAERRRSALQRHQEALRGLEVRAQTCAEERARILGIKGALEAEERPELGDWNLFAHHADSMWELSKVGKHREFLSHKDALLGLIHRGLPELALGQPQGFNALQLVKDIDWNFWWSFNGQVGNRPGHQERAQRAVGALEKSFEDRYRRAKAHQDLRVAQVQAELDQNHALLQGIEAELSRALDAADAELKAADGELVEWALADRLRADNAVYEAELGHEADIASGAMGMASVGVRVHLHARASFTLLGQAVTLPEIRFTADLGELNEGEPLLDRLPQLIGGYLEEHLVATLAASLSPLALLDLLRRALAGDGAGAQHAEAPLSEFLQVYGGLDREDAALAAELLG